MKGGPLLPKWSQVGCPEIPGESFRSVTVGSKTIGRQEQVIMAGSSEIPNDFIFGKTNTTTEKYHNDSTYTILT